MLDLATHSVPDSKAFFSYNLLPAYVDEKQLPLKRKPFSTFRNYTFPHTISLILPEDAYEGIQSKQEQGDFLTLSYCKVYLRPAELLEEEFFNEYMKKGSVLMRSEGREGMDTLITVTEGQLRIELDKATYERCGLVGKPIDDKGRKHKKVRFAIELDLRAPSMLHGKKGFQRLLHALENVLNSSITFLFLDLQKPHDQLAGPISKHAPILRQVTPTITHLPRTRTPVIEPAMDLTNPLHATELLEWLGLVALESPRVSADDDMDRYLSRYDVPTLGREVDLGESAATRTADLVKLEWKGLASAEFITGMYVAARRRTMGSWCAVGAGMFDGRDYTVLSIGGEDVLCWECWD
ncbi:hypothetical protein P152DRAFT_11552 [Eremomyces bilateralis CBS 781.70]|uniref:Uncharacterized protein n=1 Tax=Eremomyces bilateralis CBS 781.70 TaxID=1392243 RepID=A0A6G1GGU5_9PEZI|nr:uncharacterized protein P152DRAFT_11552 [Eremomyces bilateralis CBS 781.70]KAF1817212.1 hypothetical protein P152DRAFT_11552 [Eremomyces bilateralis CBS 781.70]